MLAREILKQVRQIEIRTRHLVNEVFSGEYHSVFKGRGMEFAEVREYQYGDDYRSIDWNVTARYAHPYVKVLEEERELTVILAVDASRSTAFGSVNKFKSEIAAEISALLAFAAIKNNDKVGLLVFTDQIERFIPPRKGASHGMRVIRDILFSEPQSTRTNLKCGIDYLLTGLKRRAIVFLISDFFDENYERSLRILNHKHDVVAIHMCDQRDAELPSIGLLKLADAETGTELWVDTSDAELRQQYAALIQQRREQFNQIARRMNLDVIQIDTAKPYVEPLVAFFKMREHRLR
jgi:uncharacterized protein (DUF58 family)